MRLFVSSGPEQLTVPDVTGLSRDSAESRLRDEGFGVSVAEQESDEPEGDVISQSPAGGTELARGETVTITVSTGRPQVDVPDVIGLSERSANSRAPSPPGSRRSRRSAPSPIPPRTAWWWSSDPARGRRWTRVARS